MDLVTLFLDKLAMLMNKIWQGREFSRIQNWKVRDFVTDAVKDILAARKAQAMRRHVASMGFCQDFSSNECLKMTCYQKKPMKM